MLERCWISPAVRTCDGIRSAYMRLTNLQVTLKLRYLRAHQVRSSDGDRQPTAGGSSLSQVLG